MFSGPQYIIFYAPWRVSFYFFSFPL